MTATAVVGQEGQSQLGVNFMLGGPPATGSGTGALRAGTGAQPQASSFLAGLALPFIAHLYQNNGTFKTTLGPLASRPKLKWALNSTYQPITVELTTGALEGGVYGSSLYGSATYGYGPGDLIALTEQGGDGSIQFTGTVEQVIDIADSRAPRHQIGLTPLGAELGDTPFSRNYVVPTDVGQMVRDAVAQTAHCAVTGLSCPNTGVLAVNNFNQSKVLDVLDFARKNAGATYFHFCDAQGIVWFQPQGSAPSGGTGITVRRGPDTENLSRTQDIAALRNSVFAVGGSPSGATAPITATYNGSSQSVYGKRVFDPPPSYPDLLDQVTLNQIAATIGAVFDRVHNRVEASLPSFGKKIVPNQPGGPVFRYWSPAQDSLAETFAGTQLGSGTYSPSMIVLDCEQEGIQQTIVAGDIPVSGIDDLNAEINRIARVSVLNAISVVPMAVPVTPLSSGGQGQWSLGAGVLSLQDSTGATRVQIGNLSTYTDPNGVVSPAGFQIRNLDGSGNVVFDSLGVVSLTKILINDISNVGGTQAGGGASTWTTLHSNTFTLSRQLPVMLVGLMVAYDSQTNAIAVLNIPTRIIVTGQAASGQGSVPGVGSSGATTPLGSTLFQTLTLASGSYTLNLQWNSVAATDTLHWVSYTLIAVQLGS